ncbi:MAG: NAD(+) diphosphatase [Methanospirillaceae archaeon]|nr:NAD(+) diphosphatase [Methanospirillaceae archaeon]
MSNYLIPFAIRDLGYDTNKNHADQEQWILTDGSSVITHENNSLLTDPVICRDILRSDSDRFIIGSDSATNWYAVPISDTTVLPGSCRKASLRSLYGIIPDDTLGIASRAAVLVMFYRTHRYCGICGAETRKKDDEHAVVCTACSHVFYPVINPVVIVCITRGHQILLARSPHFIPKIYSIIAGFVEAGETLEHAVAREVAEEVGILVKNVRYHCSQPWPFPHSLMIGFTANYAGGEIRIDPGEIEDAGWYTPGSLPLLPASGSISRILIDMVVDEIHHGSHSIKKGGT